jgi:CubicO group peptidase (beta-lactamase class C family)
MQMFCSAVAIYFLLTLSVVLAHGQTVTPDQQLSARVDSIFSPYARSDAPGCAVSVMKAGKILYARGYGMADVAHSIPLTPATPFIIASTTKPFTALAVLLLEKEGKLRLDDDVRKYVPEVPNFGHPITIRMLLNHTSGLRELHNLFNLAGWRNSDVQLKEDVFYMIRRQRALNHAPGAEFAYNSSGYTLLAIVVERVSGVSFSSFVNDRIFTPLGMTHSYVEESINQVIPHRATGYWGHDPAKLRTTRPVNSFPGPNGIVTSVEDLARWDENFYLHRVGTPAILNQMSTPNRLPDGTEFGYGLGFFIGMHRGRRTVSHAGSDYGYKADFIRFPAEQLTVAVLCNAFDIPPTPLALQVADLYLPPPTPSSEASPMPSVVGVGASENPADFAGRYWSDAQRRLGPRVVYENGKLLIDGGGEGMFELRPLGNNSYRLTAAPRRLIFTFVRRAGAVEVRVDREGSPLAKYRKVTESKPTAAVLRSLEGNYFSPELDVTWKFVVRDGALVLERRWTDPSPLSAVFGKVFVAPDGFVLEFSLDLTRRRWIVEISTERARRVRFVRVAPNGSR